MLEASGEINKQLGAHRIMHVEPRFLGIVPRHLFNATGAYAEDFSSLALCYEILYFVQKFGILEAVKLNYFLLTDFDSTFSDVLYLQTWLIRLPANPSFVMRIP